MKTFTTKLTALLLALLLCLSLAGCAQTDSTSDGTSESESDSASDSASDSESAVFTPRLDADEQVTLNIVGSLENFEALEAVITDFEEYYPNCEVVYTYLGYDMLPARLNSDDSVGLFMTTVSRYQRDDFYSEFCVNLQDEDIDLSAVQPEAIEACTVDGVTFGLPLAENTSGMIVNVSLLEEAGLSVPTNYSEFLNACEVLKGLGYTPVQGYERWGDDGDEASDDTYIYKYLAWSLFRVLLSDEYEAEGNLDALSAGEEGSAAVLQPVFDVIAEIVENGYTDHEVNKTYEDNYNDSILKFFEGDVPFLVGTSETYSGTKKRETKSESYSADPFEYSFISAPLAEDGAYTFMEVWQALCVNSNCPDKEWALEFLRFLATEEELNQMASVKGLPSVAVNSTDERYENLRAAGEEYYRMNGFTVPTEIDDALSVVSMEIVTGEVDAAGAAAEMESLLRSASTSDE